MRPLTSGDPRHLGGYRLLRRLGAGGMGRVFLARSARGRLVAVKVIRPELADDDEFRTRFRAEADAALRVDGRWTARLLDADPDADLPWLATAYLPGPSLQLAVRQRGPLPGPTVHALGAGLAVALDAVHGAGLMHRDLKPSNVMLTLDGPRLIDFGIARAVDASTLTRTGVTIGSPAFMSPEQIAGPDAGQPSDLFSLASTLVYAATGATPFGPKDDPGLPFRIGEAAPDLRGVPDHLHPVLAACLAKDPAARPTAAQVADALAPGGDPTPMYASGWLPGDIVEALAVDATTLLELEDDPDETVVVPSADQRTRLMGADRTRLAGPEAEPSTPRRRRGRAVATYAAVVVLAAGAAGGGLWAAGWRHDSGAKKPKAAPSPTAVAQLTELPPEYAGRWTGNAPNGPLINSPDKVVVNVTLARGPVGGVTGDVNYTRFNDYGNGILCGATLKLVAAQPTGMKVVPLDPQRAGFCANPDAAVMQRPDNTLDWTGKLPDGTPYIVTLHRV